MNLLPLIKNYKKALSDIGFLWISQIVTVFLGFLTQLILTRTLSLSDYGAFSTALNLAMILGSIASLGSGQNLLRIFGKEGWNGINWVYPTIKINILSVILCALLMVVFIVGFDFSKKTIVFALPFIVILINRGFSTLAESKYQLEEKYKKLAILKSTLHILRFIIAILLIFLPFKLFSLGLGYVLASAIVFIFYLNNISRLNKSDFNLVGHQIIKVNKRKIKLSEAFIQILPFSLASIFYLLYFQGNVVLVNLLLGEKYAGIYNIVFTVMNVLYLLPLTFYQSYLIPKTQRWAITRRSAIVHIFDIGQKMALTFGVIIGVLVAISCYYLIPLLFGENYRLSALIIILLAVTLPIRILGNNLASILVTEKNVLKKGLCQGVGAVFNIIFNIVFVNYIGIYSFPIGSIVTEALITLLFLLITKKSVDSLKHFRGSKINQFYLLTVVFILLTIVYFFFITKTPHVLVSSMFFIISNLLLIFIMVRSIIGDFSFRKA